MARRKECTGSPTQIPDSYPLILPKKSAFCIIATALDVDSESVVSSVFVFPEVKHFNKLTNKLEEKICHL